MQQILHARDKAVDVVGPDVQRLPPRKGKQAMRQRSSPSRGGRRRIHEARNLIELTCRHASANDIDRPDDAGQKVVEVVGDAAGKLADRLHFLGLTQGLLSCSQFSFRGSLGSNIPAGAIDVTVLGNADPGDPAIAAVLAAIPVGEAERRLADLGQFETGAGVLQVIGVQQVKDRHADDLLFRPSQHALPRWVGRFEITL